MYVPSCNGQSVKDVASVNSFHLCVLIHLYTTTMYRATLVAVYLYKICLWVHILL